MLARLLTIWLPRFLRRITLAISILLILLVAVAPWLDTGNYAVLSLFAEDWALRRICLASAIGLIATASIFFRPIDSRAAIEADQPPIHRRPPLPGAGA